MGKNAEWLPAASERTGNKRGSDIARREGIFGVIGQKSAEVIVVAARLTRMVQRRAKHEEKGGAVTDSIWTLNPTGELQTAVSHVASHSRSTTAIRERRVSLLMNRPLRTCTVGGVGRAG